MPLIFKIKVLDIQKKRNNEKNIINHGSAVL